LIWSYHAPEQGKRCEDDSLSATPQRHLVLVLVPIAAEALYAESSRAGVKLMQEDGLSKLKA